VWAICIGPVRREEHSIRWIHLSYRSPAFPGAGFPAHPQIFRSHNVKIELQVVADHKCTLFQVFAEVIHYFFERNTLFVRPFSGNAVYFLGVEGDREPVGPDNIDRLLEISFPVLSWICHAS
jgi:hypothetical protein